MIFRKKPIYVDAFKLGVDCIPDWFTDEVTKGNIVLRKGGCGTCADIKTSSGYWQHADCGEYIIRGVQGEIYPCKPDIFGQTYEPA